MSDANETIAAIVAEMRKAGYPFEMSRNQLNAWLDRIDAAAKRMENCFGMALAIDEGLRKRDRERAGSAAAMREALMKCNEFFRCDDDNRPLLCNLARKADEATQAALSAPARNCDRFATEDEAREAYWAYREPLEFNDKPFVAITEWLFAPAEGGAE